jgi:hypothetical protein
VLLAYGLRRKSSRDFDRPYAQKAIGLTVLVPKSIFVFPIDIDQDCGRDQEACRVIGGTVLRTESGSLQNQFCFDEVFHQVYSELEALLHH